jgi:hypothetical protein
VVSLLTSESFFRSSARRKAYKAELAEAVDCKTLIALIDDAIAEEEDLGAHGDPNDLDAPKE